MHIFKILAEMLAQEEQMKVQGGSNPYPSFFLVAVLKLHPQAIIFYLISNWAQAVVWYYILKSRRNCTLLPQNANIHVWPLKKGTHIYLWVKQLALDGTFV